jgi:hypothetical protein
MSTPIHWNSTSDRFATYWWAPQTRNPYVVVRNHEHHTFEVWEYLGGDPTGEPTGDRWFNNKYKCLNEFPTLEAAQAAYLLLGSTYHVQP